MPTFIENLQWRFATKSFDPERKISEQDLEAILNAIRFAPSSAGMQPFQVIIVTNPELRAKISEVSYGQSQVTQASHLLVFCARNDHPARAERMLELLSEGDEVKRAELKGLEGILVGSYTPFMGDPEKAFAWGARQAYIALGFGLAAAAELQIDSCPMEGFDPMVVHKVLGLPENIRPLAFLTLGYRAAGPSRPKFRYPEDEIFVTVT